ncbi:MAG: aminoglycoside phosphotransferase family protein [Chloroflexota bacterium]
MTESGRADVADERLRHSRRLDWRFLLDEPTLGSVLLSAGEGSDLGDALRAIAGSVRSLDGPAGAGGSGPPAGVIVLERPGRSTLARAVDAVPPGGWLVVELDGPLFRHEGRWRVGPAGGAVRMARRLRAAGLDAVSTHLAWPDHGSPTALVPLDGPTALAAMLARREHRWIARAARRLGPLVARARLPQLVAPATIVLARRPYAGRDRLPSDAGWLAARLAASPDTASGTSPGAPEVLLLTPRYRASAHVVGLALDLADPEAGPARVVKAARLPDGGGSLAREAAALRQVEPMLGVTGHAPRVIGLGTDAGVPYLVETGLAGRALDPATVRRDPRAAADAIRAFVARLPVTATAAGEERPFERLVSPAWHAVSSLVAGRSAPEDLGGIGERLIRSAASARLPTVVEHGDLAHPNLLLAEDGRLAAVDWERAETAGLPLHDLVMGLAYVCAAARGARTPSDQAAAFTEALTGSDPWAGAIVDAELDRLGIARHLRGALLIAPWLRTAAWLAERTATDWLVTDRSIALARAMLRVSDLAGGDRPS